MIKYEDKIYISFAKMSLEDRIKSISYLCQMLIPTNTTLSELISELIPFIRDESDLYNLNKNITNQLFAIKLDNLEDRIRGILPEPD